MIITKRKTFDDILGYLKDADSVYIVGCELCATVCRTGGKKEVTALTDELSAGGKKVTGWSILNPACNMLEVKRLHRKEKDNIDKADAVLSLACGGGTQALGDIIREKDIFPGNDTLFQGEIDPVGKGASAFDQRCSLCGDCMLFMTGDICPVTRCPKGLLNGPCGGVKNGKCEVDNETDCVWLVIYDKIKRMGKLERLKDTFGPKNNKAGRKPQHIIVK